MRASLPIIIIAVSTLLACAPTVPDSARGVGFDGSVQAEQARDAALERSTIRVPETYLPPEGGTGAPPPITGVSPVPGSAEATAAETTRVLEETRTQPTETVQAQAPAPDNSGISEENDFASVSEARSIESDAERLEQNRAQYEVIQPEALPERTGSEQPNIVAFALATNHPVGTSVYARAGLNGAARAERNCRAYPSPDQAQIDFLARGGPKRDRLGLDPDGDGYACSWDPSPFRKAGQG